MSNKKAKTPQAVDAESPLAAASAEVSALQEAIVRAAIVWAPWTKTQVNNLNRWQTCGLVHPFTCGACRDANPLPEPTWTDDEDAPPEAFVWNDYPMRATIDGWVCDTCESTQNWAFNDMATFTAAKAKAGNPFVTIE